jgi:A/G-specific adenine glycosylase
MAGKQKISFFRKVLLKWFGQNGRDFPWREKDVSNYEMIISEILLQRTQAKTVSNYYSVFFSRYPDWNALSKATLEDLEEILKPLGLYKHRAKRLMLIIEEYNRKNGILPNTVQELRESNFSTLYTSNAYEIFILKNRSALLDVNMARVFSRYFDMEKPSDVRKDKAMLEFALNVLDIRSCKELNWAILDYASLVCTSKNPDCISCGLKSHCSYYINLNDKT